MEINYETNLANPVVITIENKTDIIQTIRYFKVNMVEKLNPSDSIVLSATTSEELAYYTELKNLLDGNGTNKAKFENNIITNSEFQEVTN